MNNFAVSNSQPMIRPFVLTLALFSGFCAVDLKGDWTHAKVHDEGTNSLEGWGPLGQRQQDVGDNL
jgi:hypothetical protein